MKKVMLVLVMSVFLFSMVSATDTEITIKTIPFGHININIIDPDSGTFNLLERLGGEATNYGDISFTYSSSVNSFDMVVTVWKEDVEVAREVIDNHNAGEPIDIVVAPEGFELFETPENVANTEESEETEEVADEEIAEEENASEEDISITTGQSVVSLEKLSKYKFYFIGILAVGALAFLILKFGNYTKKTGGKPSKKSSFSDGRINALMKRLQKDEDEIKKLESGGKSSDASPPSDKPSK